MKNYEPSDMPFTLVITNIVTRILVMIITIIVIFREETLPFI